MLPLFRELYYRWYQFRFLRFFKPYFYLWAENHRALTPLIECLLESFEQKFHLQRPQVILIIKLIQMRFSDKEDVKNSPILKCLNELESYFQTREFLMSLVSKELFHTYLQLRMKTCEQELDIEIVDNLENTLITQFLHDKTYRYVRLNYF